MNDSEIQKLTNAAIFPVENNSEKRYRATDLYAPLDSLKLLGLPVMAWNTKVRVHKVIDSGKRIRMKLNLWHV